MSHKPGLVAGESERGAYPEKGVALGDAVGDGKNKSAVKKKKIKDSLEMKINLSTEAG